jgi:hypothetical protein
MVAASAMVTKSLPSQLQWIWTIVRLSPTTAPKIQDSFHVWVALQAKYSIPIFGVLQQQDPKENHFCKWVSKREDTQI